MNRRSFLGLCAVAVARGLLPLRLATVTPVLPTLPERQTLHGLPDQDDIAEAIGRAMRKRRDEMVLTALSA